MKRLISLLLIICICMATYTSVAFANADLSVLLPQTEVQEEEISESSDEEQLDTNAEQEVISVDSIEVEQKITEIENEEVPVDDTDENQDTADSEHNEQETASDNAVEEQEEIEEETEKEDENSIENIEEQKETEVDNENEETAEITEAQNISDKDNNEENPSENSEAENDIVEIENNEELSVEPTEEQQEEITVKKPEETGATENTAETELEIISAIVVEPSEDSFQTSFDEIIPGQPEIPSEARRNFFSVFDDEIEGFRETIEGLYGDKSDLTFSYGFLGSDLTILSNREKVITYLHSTEFRAAYYEPLIAIYNLFSEDDTIPTEISIIYSGSDEYNLYLKSADGSMAKITNVEPYGDDGKKIARLKLSKEALSGLSYFRNSYCGLSILKLACDSAFSDIVIHDISVSAAKGSFAVVRAMDAECHFYFPAVGLSITSSDEEYFGALFGNKEDTLSIEGTSNAIIVLLAGFEESNVLISSDLDKTMFDIYLPSESPQQAIDKVLDQVNSLNPIPDATTNPDDKDGDGKPDDEDETEGDDGKKLATDTDLNVATDTDLKVATDTDLKVATDTDLKSATDTDLSIATNTDLIVATNTDLPLFEMEEKVDASPVDSIMAAEDAMFVAQEIELATNTDLPASNDIATNTDLVVDTQEVVEMPVMVALSTVDANAAAAEFEEAEVLIENVIEEKAEETVDETIADADEIIETSEEESEEEQQSETLEQPEELETKQLEPETKQTESEPEQTKSEPEPETKQAEPEPEPVQKDADNIPEEIPADANIIPEEAPVDANPIPVEEASPIIQDASIVEDDATPISSINFVEGPAEYTDTTVIN